MPAQPKQKKAESTVVVNPKATFERRPGDESLGPELLSQISLFAQLDRKVSLQKYPRYLMLRRFRQGEAIVRQGDAGWTAFYILTSEDMMALRMSQCDAAKRKLDQPNLPARSSDYLRQKIDEWNQEIGALNERVDELRVLQGDANLAARLAASARLNVNLNKPEVSRGIFARLQDRLLNRAPPAEEQRPQYVANDGPTDISLESRQAPLYEGETFGEMSCSSRSPRSATVVAERDCYMLEMLGIILDQLRKDENYQAREERVYQQRVLEIHLRGLSILADLDESEFEAIRRQVELRTYEPGKVIFDEGDDPDGLYLIRSGLVKIIKDVKFLLELKLLDQETEPARKDLPAANWAELRAELARLEGQSGPHAKLWQLLGEQVQAMLRGDALLIPAPTNDSLSFASRRLLLDALNRVIKDRDRELVQSLGRRKSEVRLHLDDPYEELLAGHEEEVNRWSDLEVRECLRLFLEDVCSNGLPKMRDELHTRRTLAYLGRGEFFGGAGVLGSQPRGATCLAYNHPDNGQGAGAAKNFIPARVELVRIPRDAFLDLCERCPSVRAKVEKQEEHRKQANAQQGQVWTSGKPSSARLHPRFEELGLMQGQKLMLVDLDRCTRCGDCMTACVNTHRDGASRLFLDGPRFGKYLVPNACRKCLDPVCMIGCPVRSIVKGESNEIVIKDWCIGCGVCAENCPYGSIHMHALDKLDLSFETREKAQRESQPSADSVLLDDSGSKTKEVELRAVVCDLCSSLPSKEPACVYHCPHDAALRIDASREFPGE